MGFLMPSTVEDKSIRYRMLSTVGHRRKFLISDTLTESFGTALVARSCACCVHDWGFESCV